MFVRNFRMLLGLALAAVGLSLAGCFISSDPFITPATADYPFADGTILVEFHRSGAVASGWEKTERWRIAREGAYYKLAGLAADGNNETTEPFLLKCLDREKKCRGRYAIFQARHTDPNGRTYFVYGLLEFADANTTLFRSFNAGIDIVDRGGHKELDECARLSEKGRGELGIELKDFENGKSCVVPSFQALENLLMSLVRSGAEAETAYVKTANE